MADLSSDLIEARGFFADSPTYDDSRDYPTSRRVAPETEKPARASQTVISRARDIGRNIIRPDQINRDIDRAVNQRYQQVKRAFKPVTSIVKAVTSPVKKIRRAIAHPISFTLEAFKPQETKQPRRNVKLITRKEEVKATKTLHEDTNSARPRDVRESENCKRRPEDNKKRGGGSRDFIPWCEKRRSH
jgi:hypothetical protein